MSFIGKDVFVAKQTAKAGGEYGISSKSLGELGKETNYASRLPWTSTAHSKYDDMISKPSRWTDGDTFLVKKFGTNVSYAENYHYKYSDKQKYYKTIGRYSSEPVQLKLKQTGNQFTEKELLKAVDYIEDSCDLKNTTIDKLPKLKSVGRNLTLDIASALKKMDGLESVDGKIWVIAKNQSDVTPYLKKLGIMDNLGNLIPKVKEGVHFIMKNYL